MFSLSVAIALSAANVFYRDIGNLSRHLLRFWFYLSPTLYSPAVILNSKFVQENEWAAVLYNLNPWVHLPELVPQPHLLRPGPGLAGRSASCCSCRCSSSRARSCCSSGSSPTFAKVL